MFTIIRICSGKWWTFIGSSIAKKDLQVKILFICMLFIARQIYFYFGVIIELLFDLYNILFWVFMRTGCDNCEETVCNSVDIKTLLTNVAIVLKWVDTIKWYLFATVKYMESLLCSNLKKFCYIL